MKSDDDSLHLSRRYVWYSVIALVPIILMNNAYYGRLGNGIDYVAYWLDVARGWVALPLCIFGIISLCFAIRSFSYTKNMAAKVIFLVDSLYILCTLISIPSMF
ncbi:MAG: hypothetical protein PUK59_01750 [Actinomycetaceae bacterium]|nr:hypothetical protein [Actinomycetaceae bacterium]MDY5854108.1 hypothetical protein [Arcanobacterium sp.]